VAERACDILMRDITSLSSSASDSICPHSETEDTDNDPVLSLPIRQLHARYVQAATEECLKHVSVPIDASGGVGHMQNDTRTLRRTVQFGYNFFRLENGDRAYYQPPEVIRQLGREVQLRFGKSCDKNKEFNNIIISSYEGGYQLEPHLDTGLEDLFQKKYCFAESVYGVILVPDTDGCLYFIKDKSSRVPALDKLLPYMFIAARKHRYLC
jgi:hypothetical protein